MNLPQIDLASLPGLETATGLFGAVTGTGPYDDKVVAIMVYVYDVAPPETMI